MKYFTGDIIDGSSLTLDEYLDFMLKDKNPKIYPNNCFPSNEMLEEFLKIVKNVSNKDIKILIYRFLVHEGSYGSNYLHKECLMKDKENIKRLYEILPIYTYRLLALGKPWEGLTWLIDLLPYYPKDVLSIIDSFFSIYCQFLPDDVAFGLSNIDQIIRAKYYEIDHPIDVIYNLSPYEFEYLVAELYENMGYDIELTKKTHDNGIDIIATNNDIAKKEKILIQCKKTQKNITVKDIREFTGIIELNNATKGAFYTTSDYTSFAKKILITYNRLEMINGKEIIKLFNAHLDSNWPIKIGTISQKYRRKN